MEEPEQQIDETPDDDPVTPLDEEAYKDDKDEDSPPDITPDDPAVIPPDEVDEPDPNLGS